MPVKSSDNEEEDLDEDIPQYDFTTGKLRSARRFDGLNGATASVGGADGHEGALITRNEETALATGVYGVGGKFKRIHWMRLC